MPFDKDFWKKVGAKHNLSSEQIDAIAANDGLLGEFNEMFLRRDDARQLTEQAQASQRAADQAKAEAQQAYQQNLEWYGKKQADLMLVDQYRDRYGELTADGGNGRQPILSPMTEEEINKRVRGGQREVYSLTTQLLDAADDYRDRFGKSLPRKELESIALKPENSGREFKDIYSDWVTPQVKAKETEAIDARIKTAADKAFADGMAKGRMREPTQSSPDDISPLYGPRVEKKDAPDDVTLQRHFIETYDKGMEAERASAATT